MSLDDENALKNASMIIERFGGIRPMAAKVGAPVTTVQGWKKRDVIPGSRRDDVLKAANENSIDLSDLLQTVGAQVPPMPSIFKTESDEARAPEDKVVPFAAEYNNNIKPVAAVKPTAQREYTARDTTHEELMAAIDKSQKKAVSASLWTAGVFTLLIAGASFLALVPTAKQVRQQEQKIAVLEGRVLDIGENVQEMNAGSTSLQDMLPENLQKRMVDLKAQADDISQRVMAADAGSLSDRLSVLEAKLNDIEGGQAVKDMSARVRGLEATFAGQTQLLASINELRTIVDSLDGQVNTLDQKMAEAQKNEASPLGQTIEGISGSDMKAAALLIAFAQLRESLNRNEPFVDDVVLLQKLVGKDDPALQAALDRLAPQAEKGGVLTSEGLSDEFKTLAGDIVFSSLKGEKVSIADKAKMQITQALNVKKDGELVGGTPTQKAVAKAQSQLDAGDVQGAIATLKTLDGNAAGTAAPFIEQAQAAVLADDIQNMLRQMIVANVGGDMSTAAGMVEKAKQTATDVQNAVTGGGTVVKDEKSGFAILPAPKGFKGFSDGPSE
jgi:hypothetical protein